MAGAVTRAQARPVRKMVFVDGLCHKDTGETCLRILSLRKNMHTHCKRLKVDAATSTAKAWARLPNFPLRKKRQFLDTSANVSELATRIAHP